MVPFATAFRGTPASKRPIVPPCDASWTRLREISIPRTVAVIRWPLAVDRLTDSLTCKDWGQVSKIGVRSCKDRGQVLHYDIVRCLLEIEGPMYDCKT